jgi:hypothetical protein
MRADRDPDRQLTAAIQPDVDGSPMSTARSESCKDSSHELVQARRTSPRLSSWQSKRDLDPRGAGIDRAEGTRRLHLRGSCSLGRSEPGGALPAFPRPRRAVDRRSTARLRSIRGYAGKRLGRRPSRCLHSLRPCRQSLSPIRKERADYSAMFEAGIPPIVNGCGDGLLHQMVAWD